MKRLHSPNSVRGNLRRAADAAFHALVNLFTSTMFKYTLRRLFGAVVVIFCVFTISFLIMRLAPGSPFDADKELPAQVIANQAEVTGMAAPIGAPLSGVIKEILVGSGDKVNEGDVFVRIVTGCQKATVRTDAVSTVQKIRVKVGQQIEQDDVLLVTSLRSYRSPKKGKVDRIAVRTGQKVGKTQLLIRLEFGCVVEDVKAAESFTVFRVVRKAGDKIGEGKAILYRRTSLLSQYWSTLKSYVQLDFGTTFTSKGTRTVIENIKAALPVSMELGLYALIFALIVGVSSGLLAGLKQNSWVDHTVMSVSMIGISVPSIVMGPLMILVFIVWLQWLPVYGGWESGLFTDWGHKILPSIALGLGYAAYFARLTRGGMLEIVRQDFIRTARAKGLPPKTIVTRHALKGAILPTVTFLGPAVAHLLVGSVVIERIFNIPGISDYFIQPAINRDYPMVMGVVVLYTILLVVFNLVVDLAYVLLDPRVKYD
jgi:oligopeptide transport system permease protein